MSTLVKVFMERTTLKDRLGRNQFPRTMELPSQSSKYWAKEKDRYLRQLLISDIEEQTERELLVYFARLDQPITDTDPDDLSEIFEGIDGRSIDLMIQTPGGKVDAVEKMVTVLRNRTDDYRVIVPSWAKSGGTVIALSSTKIVLGVNSELGPIDPQMLHPQFGMVPAEYLMSDPTMPPTIQKIAEANVKRMRALAESYLKDGMLAHAPHEVETVVKKISSANTYMSHGAVIDHSEALGLGLSVEYLEPSDALWRRIWLLYCLYDFDLGARGLGKVFEGCSYSLQRPPLGG